MQVTIHPRKISGTLKIPPSKSMAHRAVICASLCKGISKISNIEMSDDIIATIEGMKSLGTKIECVDDTLIIDGRNSFSKKGNSIDCNESGSTLRFLIPISISHDNKVKFVGRGNLGKRPLDVFYEIFDKQNIKYSHSTDGTLDLDIEGKLSGGDYYVRGDISSQFITGLLFTLPMVKEDSRIIITTKMESKGYIDLTLDMMKKFGIEIINNDYKEFIIKGNQEYKSFDYRVEGDYSQGAFFLCADAIGNNVDVRDLNLDSLQGDKEIIDILKKLGVDVHHSEDINDSIKADSCITYGTIIDGAQCPDIIPVVTVVCALSKGKSNIINAGRLRIKECDRLSAITSELNKLGADIIEKEDGLIINGVEKLNGGRVSSHKDHRIAMSLAIAATVADGDVIIDDAECVSKSYPGFWDDYKSLGGNIS